jgi:hypothetical protein
MAELKTRATDDDVEMFLSSVEDELRRSDARTVCALITKVAKAPPVMWGTSIVGFGHRVVRYADGRETDWMAVGFSPRKANTTLYLTGGLETYADLLADLGKHTTGKGCLYVKRLSDVDLAVLRKIVGRSVVQARTS